MAFIDLPPVSPVIEVVQPQNLSPLAAPAQSLLVDLKPSLKPLPGQHYYSDSLLAQDLTAIPDGDRFYNLNPLEGAVEPSTAADAQVSQFPLPNAPLPEEPLSDEPTSEASESDPTRPLLLDEASPQVDITADYQDFDPIRQVVTAVGNVQLQLNDAILQSDKLWINLNNRYALAEGDVLLTRGEQIVRGQRAEYSFTLGSGVLFEAQGDLFFPSIEADFSSPVAGPTTSRSIFDPLNPDHPVGDVSSPGGLEISTNQGQNFANAQGGLRRLRFQAERVYFDADIWEAETVRITNDPFSPPELEFTAERVDLVGISAEEDLLTARNPRLVFDQGFSLPLLRSQFILTRGALDPDDLNPFPTGIGIDGRDRGGLFIERRFDIINRPNFNLGIAPQYLITRGLSDGVVDGSAFGAEIDLSARLGPRTTLTGLANFSSFQIDEVLENLRANARVQHYVGDHTLSLEYSYRDRLFNGSLGFQDVRSTIGAVLVSPSIRLTESGLFLNYQAGAQYITSETDRADLLGVAPIDNLVSLGRFQSSAALSHGFTLWQGQPLPATRDEGLRYSPFPLTPNLTMNLGLRGTGTYYTSNDFQGLLTADIRFDGQFGHLAKQTLDYTRFNIGYSRSLVGGDNSPFTFDRAVDQNVLTFGLMQQIYGPFLLGFQTSLNLDTGRGVNTEIIGEYSRRTYGIVLRYSPTQSTGAIGFRLSDFNWIGNSDPFDNPRIRQVEGSVVSP